MTPSLLDKVLVIAIPTLSLAVVFWTLLTLHYHPAPPFSVVSLRGKALRTIPKGAQTGLVFRLYDRWRGRFGWLRFGAYAIAILGVAQVPLTVRWGPLGDATNSKDYLGTLWQVVAGALGISVAIIAFAFEAFESTGRRAYGGTLREFAKESGLIFLIEAGIVSIFVDGATLAGWGHEAPKGWAGLWAMMASAFALALVGVVAHRVLRLLDDQSLREMRTRRVGRLVTTAMRHQLTGQAADIYLGQSGLGVERHWMMMPGFAPVYATKEGEVHDVWIGPLARLNRSRRGVRVALGVGLGQRVDAETPVLFVIVPSGRVPRHLQRTIRVNRRRNASPQSALSAALARLHQQAVTAAKRGDELEWRAISEAYEQILLAMPRAAAAWGVPFEGAVAAPGFFGQGPVQQIARFLYDELAAAVEANNRELVGPISYFPQHIASAAARLGAPAVAGPMLEIFPAMYVLAKTGR